MPLSTGSGQTPPEWAEAYHRVAMLRRREGKVRFAAWERPGEVVQDIRELADIVASGPFPVGVVMTPMGPPTPLMGSMPF